MYDQPNTYGPPGDAPAAPPPPAMRARWSDSLVPLAQAAAAAVAGIALSITGYATGHAHPASALRHWHAAMAAGDVAALRSDERLGMRLWVSSLTHELGEREYARVLGIFDRARQFGEAEVTRLREQAASGAQAAFAALPWQEQSAVVRQSHVEWVYEHGYAAVPEAAVVGPWRTLLAVPPPPELLQRLGTPALDADEQTLLAGRAASDPAVAGDPMLASLAARRAEEGETALRRLRDRVEREGERAFRGLNYQSRDAVDRRSRQRFLVERGFASLSAADRAKAGSAEALEDATGALAERLGRQQLPPAEQREIGGRTREDFVRGRASYVEATGTRLAQELLRKEYGGSRFHYEGFDVTGAGGRDLLRRQSARAELAWDTVGTELRDLPAAVALRWVPRSADWRVVDVRWRPRPGADGTPPQGGPAAPADAPRMTPAPGDGAGEGEGAAE